MSSQKRPDPQQIADQLARASGIKSSNGSAKKSRSDQKPIMLWNDPAVRKQLKMLAAETGRTQQSLLNEALNLLFKEHNKPPIA
jgi:hypothetical protein